MPEQVISSISTSFPALSQSEGQVTHVLLTRSPLTRRASPPDPSDLHVLSTPPAFVLSQDQTLRGGSTPNTTPETKAPRPAKGKQTPKGKRFQPSRTSQTDSIPNQPKKNPTHQDNPK